MLKGIPSILSPILLKVLCEMGHGDRIVIADGNFPSASVGRNAIVIRCDGHGVPEILDAVLQLFPLDKSVDKPVKLMAVTPGDQVETPIWDTYIRSVSAVDPRGKNMIAMLDRYSFYGEAEASYAIIATGERALYANIILQKGVVTD